MVNGSPETHAHLIPRLQAGDPMAFDTLYDAYSPMMYGLIIRIVEDRDEAENLLQDAFVKVWQNIGSYSPEKGRIATWLINIARNTAIDFTRSKYFHQKPKNQNIEKYVHHENEHTLTQPLVDTLGLRQLVQKLTPVCRDIIEWMYFEGYTQQEIADNFGIPLGTVKSRTRIALKELRSFYN